MDHRDTVFYRYHEYTKHTPAKLYSRAWHLDWANQPDPFRRYDGAPRVELPVPTVPPTADYFALQDADRGPSVCIRTVSRLLYYSMAIATWKEVPGRGLRWALRVNPSSGNLHPTETHLITRGIDGLDDGCYHFRVDDYALEARCSGTVDDLAALFARQCGLPAAPLTILLTSIFWREAWKYRDRGFRYCHHDLGHALAAITEAARGLGLPVDYRHLFDDDTIADALGLDGGDEAPGLLIAIGDPGPAPPDTTRQRRRFVGTPNSLSAEIVDYDSIATVYAAARAATRNPEADPRRIEYQTADAIELPQRSESSKDFWTIVRTRRSGVDFDGQTGTDVKTLGAVLRRATRGAPGDLFNTPAGAGRPLIHLYLYVHRVAELDRGLYYYDRARHALITLGKADLRREAAHLSLQQAIAADGAFAVSMIADLAASWDAYGERSYRAVHVEAGFIGQGLYLGAEAAGLNATGIGAFFDDDVNTYLKLPEGFEVIYHFTVGRAVHDARLADRPAYAFESRATSDNPTVC
ncbi:MAG: SagB/ThcOx family dehydrogenase [Planctomycetota bacterium]|jgi:SagB-type dehydrogenase family enzyme